jgi:hypothetical protein
MPFYLRCFLKYLKVGEEEEEERQCCNVGPPSPPHPAFILLIGFYAKKER